MLSRGRAQAHKARSRSPGNVKEPDEILNWETRVTVGGRGHLGADWLRFPCQAELPEKTAR